MEFTLTYIISQVFTILMYIFLGITYYVKDRKKLLIIHFIATISCSIAYFLLEAWTGLAMCIVVIIRNIIFLLDEKKNGKKDIINKKDIVILIILFSISIVFAIFTYDGPLSLLSVLATLINTYAIWQKKINIYRLLGIATGTLWVFYNLYIMSIFGIILEAILLICSITGYVLSIRKIKKCNSIKDND